MKCYSVLFIVFTLASAAGFGAKWFNPLHQAKTGLSYSLLLSPELQTKNPETGDTAKARLEGGGSWAATIAVEIPIYPALNGGFMFQLGAFRHQPDPLSPEATGLGRIDMDAFLKLQLPLSLGASQALAFSLIVPFGPSVVIDGGLVSGPIGRNKRSDILGYGLNTAALFQVEYFPFAEFGLFVQGGYQAAWMFHNMTEEISITQTSTNPDGTTSTYERRESKLAGTFSYFLYSPMASVGVKINY